MLNMVYFLFQAKLDDPTKPWQENGVKNENDDEKFWICHRGGFTEASRLHPSSDEPSSPLTNGPSPRTRVMLSTGETLDVDDDDLEKVLHVHLIIYMY